MIIILQTLMTKLTIEKAVIIATTNRTNEAHIKKNRYVSTAINRDISLESVDLEQAAVTTNLTLITIARIITLEKVRKETRVQGIGDMSNLQKLVIMMTMKIQSQ